MDSLNDVIKEMRLGNYDRFPLFYEETHRKVFYIALAVLGEEEATKDIVQDTYLRFISSLSRFEEGSNPYAYLATIARNLAYDHLDKRKRETSFDEAIGSEEDIGSKIDYHGLDEVKRLLEPLNESEREIVVLHVLDGLKFREIASVVDKKLSTVLVTYNRAIKKMRRKEGTSQ